MSLVVGEAHRVWLKGMSKAEVTQGFKGKAGVQEKVSD